TFDECLRMLASCATGDGNLLLNVGPMPTGEIVPEQIAVLKEMGAWLNKYGESIYATRGGPFRNGEWGGSTYSDKTIYLHVFQWKGDTLELPPLKAKILKATALTGGDGKANQTKDALRIILAPAQQDKTDTIIKLELDAPAANEFQNGQSLSITE
ncbi:MAG TPA: alpha-L-fucosidase, partial [Candidatus Bathyarchaeia archaeon]|nr:alpha-L-fucosidase [Candidatus Bathyarchaeia archaeon]